MKKKYGYGIIDRHGKPWWDESCVCKNAAPMRVQLVYMNDRFDACYEEERAPFRLVRLFWEGKRK